MGVESKLFGLTDETIVSLRNCDTRGRPRRPRKAQVHDAILIRFCCPVDKLCTTVAREQRHGFSSATIGPPVYAGGSFIRPASASTCPNASLCGRG
jgi:hypothetical protein